MNTSEIFGELPGLTSHCAPPQINELNFKFNLLFLCINIITLFTISITGLYLIFFGQEKRYQIVDDADSNTAQCSTTV